MAEANIAPDLVQLARPIAELSEDPDNVRLHDGRSIDAIVKSLERFGQQKPAVILPNGRVIAGNGLFRAAKVLGWDRLAVVPFSSDGNTDATAYAIADNRTAELSTWNDGMLRQTLAELASVDRHLVEALGFTEKEVERALKIVAEERGAAEGGASRESDPAAAAADFHVSTLIFSPDQASLDDWYRFVADLGKSYPEIETVGGRLAAWVETVL